MIFIALIVFQYQQLKGQDLLPCTAMALTHPMDSLILKGKSRLSGFRAEDCSCLGEYFAKEHLQQGKAMLLDSEWVPIFGLQGYGQCELAEHGFEYAVVPDLFYPAADRPKARAYMERYNALMLQELKRRAGEAAYQQIFKTPDMLDPYVLRQRLDMLVRYGQITKTEWLNDSTILVRLNLVPLYRNLDLTWQELDFVVIDENLTDARYLRSVEALDREGFPLRINSESRKSNVWFDFRIRVDYTRLAESGSIYTCERIEDFLYHFEHLSLTRDLKLISHLH